MQKSLAGVQYFKNYSKLLVCYNMGGFDRKGTRNPIIVYGTLLNF